MKNAVQIVACGVLVFRRNFLKVRLFYGDLKYNVVSQSRAYDALTLLSEYKLQYNKI